MCIVSSTLVNTDCTENGKNKKSLYLHKFLACWEWRVLMILSHIFVHFFPSLCQATNAIRLLILISNQTAQTPTHLSSKWDFNISSISVLIFNSRIRQKRQSYNIKVECLSSKAAKKYKMIGGCLCAKETIIWFNQSWWVRKII